MKTERTIDSDSRAPTSVGMGRLEKIDSFVLRVRWMEEFLFDDG